MRHLRRFAVFALLVACCATAPPLAGRLTDEVVGRSETRVWSGAVPVTAGLRASIVAERLDARGYARTGDRPGEEGTYFWGHERFWIYRRAFRFDGRMRDAELVGFAVADGLLAARLDGDDGALRLEPLLLSESLGAERAIRVPIELSRLPEHVWRPVVAAEDARFFLHGGIDGRAIARAAAANAEEGRAAQGGSTITQQLVKNLYLTPKKTFGRKVSEAFRAIQLEGEYTKNEILEAYLNVIYYGHVDGVAVHGLGTAARTYFSKDAARLTLAEAALLAAMIQGPNALTPERHPERARRRRDWVLERTAQEGWADVRAVAKAKAEPIRLRRSSPLVVPARAYLEWVRVLAEASVPKRLDRGRGVVVETTLDPWLQARAEDAVERSLRALRREHRRLQGAGLSAALVALDAHSGEVLAWVGGDPADHEDRFDRARKALRQPGSAVKPFVLLEALDRCGSKGPLNPATRVADEPLEIDLPSGGWSPENFDRRYHGVVSVREATRASYNVPFVRLARHCGWDGVASRMRRAGFELPDDPPPAFTLGALETTPLQMAAAFSTLFNEGRAFEPRGWTRIEKPNGEKLARRSADSRRVAGAEATWLVRELLRDAVESGTGRSAAIAGVEVVGKTGTSSSLRDAWFVGGAGGVVAAVWVGLDGGEPLGLTGSAAAAPLWRAFMREAVPARPPHEIERPSGIVTRRVSRRTGLLYKNGSRRGFEEVFRRDAMPRRDRFWRRDRATAVVR